MNRVSGLGGVQLFLKFDIQVPFRPKPPVEPERGKNSEIQSPRAVVTVPSAFLAPKTPTQSTQKTSHYSGVVKETIKFRHLIE